MKKLLLTSLLIFSLIGNCFAAGNDSDTVSLLHMNGTDGSTTFTDDAAGGTHTWTAIGNAQIDTAQSKFGGASFLGDGTGDGISTGDSADWDFGTADWTVDMWLRFNDVTGINGIIDTGQLASAVGVFIRRTATNLQVILMNNVRFNTAWSASTGVWYHLAVVVTSGTLRVFIDGTQLGSDVAVTDNITGTGAWVGIREGQGSGDSDTFDGWIDEVRVSKGIARWTSNFTPPTEEYSAAVAAPQGAVIWVEY